MNDTPYEIVQDTEGSNLTCDNCIYDDSKQPCRILRKGQCQITQPKFNTLFKKGKLRYTDIFIVKLHELDYDC